jgi:Stress responsive A/B Barrel Domain
VIVHVVLFRPKPGLDVSVKRALADALAHAATDIASIRRFRVGRHLAPAPTYLKQESPSFPYCGLVEFDDRDGLIAYLQHPAHAALGRLFNETLEDAWIYDFEVAEAARASAWIEASDAEPDT